MFDKMNQLLEMKKQAEHMKRELESTRIEVQDVRGIKIVVNGAQQFQSLEISEDFFKGQDKKRLETDLLRGINNAVTKSQAAAAQKMKNMAGFNIPGF